MKFKIKNHMNEGKLSMFEIIFGKMKLKNLNTKHFLSIIFDETYKKLFLFLSLKKQGLSVQRKNLKIFELILQIKKNYSIFL
jgi:hypothetical protein